MRIEIEIPKEFEEHFKQDKFEDSLNRLYADVHLLAGKYERELTEMLIKAFRESKPAYDMDYKGGINMSSKSIEEQKQAAQNTNELLDHLIRIIEQNDERFSFEWLVGGEHAAMEIFDKEKKIGYAVKIEPIEYDENGEAVNL